MMTASRWLRRGVAALAGMGLMVVGGTALAQFGVSDCWDEQCPSETSACQADADCTEYMNCFKAEDSACMEAIQASNPGAQEMWQALATCGWSSCNDPSAGSCAEPGPAGEENKCGLWNNEWPCNCDPACSTYGDCCWDYDAVCGDGTCTPDCAGKVCGPDGCGGTCGTCDAGENCVDGACLGGDCTDACTPGTSGCTGGVAWLCNIGDSGCYEQVEQADCGAQGMSCQDGECIEGCVPECGGKECGPDGCGGQCGTCPGDLTCAGGLCVADCEGACSVGEFGCDGDIQWTCLTGPDGCGEIQTTDCSLQGLTCTGGQCVPEGVEPDASGGTDTGGGGDDTGPSTDTGPGEEDGGGTTNPGTNPGTGGGVVPLGGSSRGGGCGGAPLSLVLWPMVGLLALRRRD